jgi:hypothetical protein
MIESSHKELSIKSSGKKQVITSNGKNKDRSPGANNSPDPGRVQQPDGSIIPLRSCVLVWEAIGCVAAALGFTQWGIDKF